MKNATIKNSLYMQIGEEIYTNPFAFLIVEKKRPSEKTKAIENFVTYSLIGARYYDADIGLWTSVDKMRQHHSGYLYGSNNPVNRIDRDGNVDGPVSTNFSGS